MGGQNLSTNPQERQAQVQAQNEKTSAPVTSTNVSAVEHSNIGPTGLPTNIPVSNVKGQEGLSDIQKNQVQSAKASESLAKLGDPTSLRAVLSSPTLGSDSDLQVAYTQGVLKNAGYDTRNLTPEQYQNIFNAWVNGQKAVPNANGGIDYTVNLTENLGISDSATASAQKNKGLSDNLTISDSVATQLAKAIVAPPTNVFGLDKLTGALNANAIVNDKAKSQISSIDASLFDLTGYYQTNKDSLSKQLTDLETQLSEAKKLPDTFPMTVENEPIFRFAQSNYTPTYITVNVPNQSKIDLINNLTGNISSLQSQQKSLDSFFSGTSDFLSNTKSSLESVATKATEASKPIQQNLFNAIGMSDLFGNSFSLSNLSPQAIARSDAIRKEQGLPTLEEVVGNQQQGILPSAFAVPSPATGKNYSVSLNENLGLNESTGKNVPATIESPTGPIATESAPLFLSFNNLTGKDTEGNYLINEFNKAVTGQQIGPNGKELSANEQVKGLADLGTKTLYINWELGGKSGTEVFNTKDALAGFINVGNEVIGLAKQTGQTPKFSFGSFDIDTVLAQSEKTGAKSVPIYDASRVNPDTGKPIEIGTVPIGPNAKNVLANSYIDYIQKGFTPTIIPPQKVPLTEKQVGDIHTYVENVVGLVRNAKANNAPSLSVIDEGTGTVLKNVSTATALPELFQILPEYTKQGYKPSVTFTSDLTRQSLGEESNLVSKPSPAMQSLIEHPEELGVTGFGNIGLNITPDVSRQQINSLNIGFGLGHALFANADVQEALKGFDAGFGIVGAGQTRGGFLGTLGTRAVQIGESALQFPSDIAQDVTTGKTHGEEQNAKVNKAVSDLGFEQPYLDTVFGGKASLPSSKSDVGSILADAFLFISGAKAGAGAKALKTDVSALSLENEANRIAEQFASEKSITRINPDTGLEETVVTREKIPYEVSKVNNDMFRISFKDLSQGLNIPEDLGIAKGEPLTTIGAEGNLITVPPVEPASSPVPAISELLVTKNDLIAFSPKQIANFSPRSVFVSGTLDKTTQNLLGAQAVGKDIFEVPLTPTESGIPTSAPTSEPVSALESGSEIVQSPFNLSEDYIQGNINPTTIANINPTVLTRIDTAIRAGYVKPIGYAIKFSLPSVRRYTETFADFIRNPPSVSTEKLTPEEEAGFLNNQKGVGPIIEPVETTQIFASGITGEGANILPTELQVPEELFQLPKSDTDLISGNINFDIGERFLGTASKGEKIESFNADEIIKRVAESEGTNLLPEEAYGAIPLGQQGLEKYLSDLGLNFGKEPTGLSTGFSGKPMKPFATETQVFQEEIQNFEKGIFAPTETETVESLPSAFSGIFGVSTTEEKSGTKGRTKTLLQEEGYDFIRYPESAFVPSLKNQNDLGFGNLGDFGFDIEQLLNPKGGLKEAQSNDILSRISQDISPKFGFAEIPSLDVTPRLDVGLIPITDQTPILGTLPQLDVITDITKTTIPISITDTVPIFVPPEIPEIPPTETPIPRFDIPVLPFLGGGGTSDRPPSKKHPRRGPAIYDIDPNEVLGVYGIPQGVLFGEEAEQFEFAEKTRNKNPKLPLPFTEDFSIFD